MIYKGHNNGINRKNTRNKFRGQNAFQEAVRSLKLYRRAELIKEDEDKLIIKDLYVDPLPSEFIFKKVLEPNTTFLIGRKGTGKSTIFQRVQYKILEEKNKTSSYIDIKTTFESSRSKISDSLLKKIKDTGYMFDDRQIHNILLYREFILDLIREIKEQLKRKLDIIDTGAINQITKTLKIFFLEME